jgi:Subtilase family
VIEAGGNGGVDLDRFQDVRGRRILDRSSPDFQDSGAVMVGAASSASPHGRLSFSNFGSRVDCYAWGENVQSTGDGWTGNALNTYTSGFGGASGASPIVTGAAVLLQAWARGCQYSYPPHTLRALLSDPAFNTASANPPVDRIGVMPNLKVIITRELGAGTPALADARA